MFTFVAVCKDFELILHEKSRSACLRIQLQTQSHCHKQRARDLTRQGQGPANFPSIDAASMLAA